MLPRFSCDCWKGWVGHFVVLALLPVSVAAQDGSRVFREQIDVRVFNLEVVVTDRQGERVAGLEINDFVLTVDGRPASIEYFDEIRGGEASWNAQEGTRATPETRVQGTSLLVFLDEVFPIGRDLDQAVGHLIENVSALGSADRMAVIAFDGKNLDMLTDWTRSPEVLGRVFEQARKRTAHGLEARVLDQALSQMSSRAVAHRRRERIERVTLAATASLRSFATAPGRKAMLVLSGGWPAGYTDEFAVSPTLAALPDTLGYRDLYRPLSDTANRLGYTLYTVDMKVFHGPSGVSAEHRSSSAGQAARDRAYAQDESENSTLVRLANETGGLAFINRRSRDALPVTLADTRSYYSLGFTPEWKGEDRRHRIGVRVLRPGLRVRTRRSFSDLSRRTEVTMVVESALLFGNAPAPGSLDVRLGEANGAGQGFRKTLLPLEIKIPLDGLTFVPAQGGWQTELELRVAAEDGQGRRNEISVVPVVLTFPRRPPPGRHAVYETALRLRKKRHALVVSLFDPASGQLFWNRLATAP